jgi:hypothetical protein
MMPPAQPKWPAGQKLQQAACKPCVICIVHNVFKMPASCMPRFLNCCAVMCIRLK